MKNTALIFLSAVAGILILPDYALGHHGLAEFDTTSNITVKATVTVFPLRQSSLHRGIRGEGR